MKEQRFNKHEDLEPRLPYLSGGDTVTKYQRLSGLSNRILFPHSSGDWKSKINVPAGLLSGKNSFLRLRKATFSLCPHGQGGKNRGRERERKKERGRKGEREGSRREDVAKEYSRAYRK